MARRLVSLYCLATVDGFADFSDFRFEYEYLIRDLCYLCEDLNVRYKYIIVVVGYCMYTCARITGV